MSLSDQIAKHVSSQYVEPARRRGQTIIEVKAGDVHRELGWKNRVTSVCTTLESQKFQRENCLYLIHTSGPASGRSTTVSFSYQLLDPAQSLPEAKLNENRGKKLLALCGLGAETFRALGGGEEFLRRERVWGPDAWERYEAEKAKGPGAETSK